ncbi:MAG: nicotinate-nucleotide--dimethylbenzimidazole phosphoribosyltransferase, partial [Firmicutes bacterium]|nr:nicotinate-nucleotide--dimethylbenzimidazole phosphoribosyltransferase [Bacillota bacterium]
TLNLTRGKTGAATLSRFYNNELYVYDVGVNAEIKDDMVIGRKIAFGTKNIAKEQAMTREEAMRAMLVGIEAAVCAKADGVSVIGVGEMGIGNTTTSSAVLAALTGAKVSDVTGRGGGINDASYAKKLKIIESALERYSPDRNDPVDVLCKVGGFDICPMTGAYLAGAAEGMAVVIDGFISIVAALCAARLCPECKKYMIASHESYEIGYGIAMKELGLKPLFNLEMRLGEGSGCPIAFNMIDAAWFVLHNMASFRDADINDEYLDEIRNTDAFSVK